MKNYLPAFMAVAFMAFVSVSCSGPKLIPKGTMSDIYADMLLADKWLDDNREYMLQADSTLFYEAVFKKYGFDQEDYLYSVDKYLYDPLRYSRIIKAATAKLERRKQALEARKKVVEAQKKLEREKRLQKRLKRHLVKYPYFNYFDSLLVMDFDTLKVDFLPDEAGRYLPVRRSVPDTLK